MIDLLDSVVLTTDIPKTGLGGRRHRHRRDGLHEAGRGFEVEFVALDGETLAVASLSAAQIRPVAHREIAHALVLRTRRVAQVGYANAYLFRGVNAGRYAVRTLRAVVYCG